MATFHPQTVNLRKMNRHGKPVITSTCPRRAKTRGAESATTNNNNAGGQFRGMEAQACVVEATAAIVALRHHNAEVIYTNHLTDDMVAVVLVVTGQVFRRPTMPMAVFLLLPFVGQDSIRLLTVACIILIENQEVLLCIVRILMEDLQDDTTNSGQAAVGAVPSAIRRGVEAAARVRQGAAAFPDLPMVATAQVVVASAAEASVAEGKTVLDAMEDDTTSIVGAGRGVGVHSIDPLHRQALLFHRLPLLPPPFPRTMKVACMAIETRERMTLSTRTKELCLSTNWS